MTNVVCLTIPTLVVGPVTQAGLKRSVYVQNQSAEIIYLKFDRATEAAPLSPVFGFKLAAGADKTFAPQNNGSEDGSTPIYAVSASGTAILNVQSIIGTKTQP